jgi:hypothetical protein
VKHLWRNFGHLHIYWIKHANDMCHRMTFHYQTNQAQCPRWSQCYSCIPELHFQLQHWRCCKSECFFQIRKKYYNNVKTYEAICCAVGFFTALEL